MAGALIFSSTPHAAADDRLLQAHRLCVEYFEWFFDLEGRLDLPVVEIKELDENEFAFIWFDVLNNVRKGKHIGPFQLSCRGYYDPLKIALIAINEDFYFDDEIPQP
jgi:hypothetical protein